MYIKDLNFCLPTKVHVFMLANVILLHKIISLKYYKYLSAKTKYASDKAEKIVLISVYLLLQYKNIFNLTRWCEVIVGRSRRLVLRLNNVQQC